MPVPEYQNCGRWFCMQPGRLCKLEDAVGDVKAQGLGGVISRLEILKSTLYFRRSGGWRNRKGAWLHYSRGRIWAEVDERREGERNHFGSSRKGFGCPGKCPAEERAGQGQKKGIVLHCRGDSKDISGVWQSKMCRSVKGRGGQRIKQVINVLMRRLREW